MTRIGIRDRTHDAGHSADHPLSLLRQAHATKLALCDRLEEIADSLPSEVSRFECEAVARAIVPLLESAQRFEEEVVFPYCEELRLDGPSIAGSFERLKAEHREDMSYGEEVAEALLVIGTQRPVPGAEALGFMLRGFFGALRRHVAFEGDYIGVIAGRER